MAPTAGTDLVFPAGAIRTATVNDLPAGVSFGSITISGAGYDISGSSLTVTGPLSSTYTSGTSVLGIDTELGSATVTVAAGGALSLNGSGITATASSIVAPGRQNAPGILRYSANAGLTLPASSTFRVDLDSPTLGTDFRRRRREQDLGGQLAANQYVHFLHGSHDCQCGPSDRRRIDREQQLRPDRSRYDVERERHSPAVSVSGTLSPHGLESADLSLTAGSTMSVALAEDCNDQVDVNGTVQLADSTLAPSIAYVPTIGDNFTIVDNDGADAVSGTFAGLPEGAYLTVDNCERLDFAVRPTSYRDGNTAIQGVSMLADRETIDQIIVRRQALASVEAAEAADLLDYVDRARIAGEECGGEPQGRRRVDAAVHELSLALRLPVPTVERHVARARRLRTHLPNVWQAWHDGRLGTSAVEAVNRAAQRLTAAASVALLDEIALDRVATLTPGQAVRWLDRWVDRTETAAAAERHALAHKDRSVSLRPAGDGMSRVTALLPAADAAAIMQSLTGAAHARPAGDPRTIDQARADLLADTLLGRKDGSLGYQAVIGVTVPLSSLMGFSNAPGELSDRSTTIPAHIIREAMQDPQSLLYRLVTDDVGNLLTVTWLGRFAPTRLKQILEFRDGTSVFPTSSVPARMCDTDHTDSWPAETSAANTGPLNRRAHNLKTQGLIELRQPKPGMFQWTTHTGHTYTRHPEPLPIADWNLGSCQDSVRPADQ